ncbi:MAG: MarR family winged helix-turn-helix transcriptional regulator [Hyphomicrobiaceae bacterium]
MTYPTEDETALWVALNFAQRAIYRQIDSALKLAGLPPLRWYDVLWSLERAGDDGLRAFELEKMLIFEQSNLSRLLGRMVGEKLVREAVFKDDRRGKVLRITAMGRQVRTQMWQIYGPLIHEHMAKIKKSDDQRRTARTLQSLIVPET